MKEMAAGGVVFRRRDGHAEWLIIRDRYGKIALPKGKMETGETEEQTALREIVEETGIRGRIVRPIETVTYQYTDDQRGLIDKSAAYFLVEATGGELEAQLEEIEGVEWCDAAEAMAKQRERGYENNNRVMEKALAAWETIREVGEDPARLARYIDHTLLKPDAGAADIRQLCEEAIRYGFYSVCVHSGWIKACREWLQGSGVKLSAVCGFPLGAAASEVKAFEAAFCAENGTDEIDMVLPIGKLLEGDEEAVLSDIRQVVTLVQSKAQVKVIMETGYLNDAQKRAACQIIEQAGAHYVKTSTGFGPGKATVEDIRLLRSQVQPETGVKASGGVRDAATAIRMIEAGADRLGTSSGIAIMQGLKDNGVY